VASVEHCRVMVPAITPVTVKVSPVRTKQRQKGCLGLGRVNRPCRGGTTRYRGTCLGWRWTMLGRGFTRKPKEQRK
jgi:hypothetical protein